MATLASRSSINTSDSSLDPTHNHHSCMYLRLQNMCNLSCRSWPDRMLAAIFISLCAGITMVIVGFLVPRSPPSGAKEELSARAYEALAQQYANRAIILDVVMVMGLCCLLIGAIALCALHVGVYFTGSGFFPLFSAHFHGRPTSNDGNDTLTSSTSEALVLSRTVSYGGLEETEH